ncbi:c-type cytochrome [Hyphomonas oceanitis]|uniref:c-type cytochrome n=1 Tax=Hyphomonas oceanitis TaxID=81033 RepID=UPI0030039D8B
MIKLGLASALALVGLSACTPTESAGPAAPAAEAAAPVEVAESPVAEEKVARGQYLVSITGCHDCHTVMTPTGPDMAHALQGGPLPFAPLAEMPWAPVAPSIAGLPEGWTESEFTAFLSGGPRPSGVPVLPPMPQYAMSDTDAAAVTAYVASLPRAAE